MAKTEGWDPELGPIVAIPEPFWVRSWRTLWRWKPVCLECYGDKVWWGTREHWERHWLNAHWDETP